MTDHPIDPALREVVMTALVAAPRFDLYPEAAIAAVLAYLRGLAFPSGDESLLWNALRESVTDQQRQWLTALEGYATIHRAALTAAKLELATIETAVRSSGCQTANSEEGEARYICLDEDGEPIIEADTLADAVIGMSACWEHCAERASRLAAETERCAAIADAEVHEWADWNGRGAARNIAAAIRAGGTP